MPACLHWTSSPILGIIVSTRITFFAVITLVVGLQTAILIKMLFP